MPAPPSDPNVPDRYSRQVLVEQIGGEGQRRLLGSRVTLIGCGALGAHIADTLVRAGVGYLRVCDRDVVELSNLQRQSLFDERDVGLGLPKAEAARLKLQQINSEVAVEAAVTDVHSGNIESLAAGADLLLDGTDNFETRYLINDLAIKTGRPWVYGAVLAASGLCMPVVPGRTRCLRCVFDRPPPPEEAPSPEVAGVLAPAVAVVAAFECIEAFKILTGRLDELNDCLTSIDLWSGRVININVETAGSDCVCCRCRQFEYLEGSAPVVQACGLAAVQVRPQGGAVSLAAIAERLKGGPAEVLARNALVLKVRVEGYVVSLFADGRAMVTGTNDPQRAQALLAAHFSL